MKSKLVIESFDNGDDGIVKDLKVSENGAYFLTIDTKNNVVVYDIQTHHVVQRYNWPISQENFDKNTQNLCSIAWAPDDTHFAAGGQRAIRVFDFSGKKKISYAGYIQD